MNQSDFTPYAHSAAGHDGLSSNASGSLIIKPCTQAEIDFYESAKHHPEFQAHMPTYMGKLLLNTDPQIQAFANQPEGQDNDPAVAASSRTVTESVSSVQADQSEPKVKDSTSKGDKDWVPSGGKKLSTGLGIVLENATTGFKKPNVLDLKLGSRLWADDAPEAKRQKLDSVAAETTTGSLGFRVAGMKVWQGDDIDKKTQNLHTELKDGYISFDKFYGRTLTASHVSDAFTSFIGGTSPNPTTKSSSFTRTKARLLLKRLLREVQNIQFVLENEESRMYSASILVIAEGDDEALDEALEAEKQMQLHEDTDGIYEDDDDDDDDDENPGPRVLEVRLIDFAHASWTPGLGPDENALKGVRSIRRVVEEVLRDFSGLKE